MQAMICHDHPNNIDTYGAMDGLSCAERDGVITDVDAVRVHIFSEHQRAYEWDLGGASIALAAAGS